MTSLITEIHTSTLHLAQPNAGLPCTDVEPERFFAETPAEIEEVKLICRACPMKQQCLNGALRRGEPHGVWGGELFLNGQIIARKRPRGRPRKTISARVSECDTAA